MFEGFMPIADKVLIVAKRNGTRFALFKKS